MLVARLNSRENFVTAPYLSNAAAQVSPAGNVPGESRDRLTLGSVSLSSEQVAVSAIDSKTLSQRLNLFRPAQISGPLNRSLGLTIQNASERVQFGKPIGIGLAAAKAGGAGWWSFMTDPNLDSFVA